MGHPHSHDENPMRRGALLALFAAIAFGATTPLVQRFGRGAGAFPIATLLYLGSSLAALPFPRARASAESAKPAPSLFRSHALRLVAIALLGALLAPASLAWGLARTSGTSATLLLNFEALFTVVLGAIFFREHVSARVGTALALMLCGGACLAFATPGGAGIGWGAIAVVGATLGWSLDNTLTRPLADLDTVAVVRVKSSLGAAVGLAVSLALGAAFPRWLPALGLVACGAIGYGASLRLYLRAQKDVGAGRTASVFAAAPFLGAAIAWALGEGGATFPTLLAAVLFGTAVYLHITEKHAHAHAHAATNHEHMHRHDDSHHDHAHDPPVAGEHTHPHHHDAMTHDHPHAEDPHHRHTH